MYILHGVPDWGSQVIHMALAELQAAQGVPFRFNTLDWNAGDLNSPAFRAMNPFGRVPVLETPDGPLFETTAILLYLAERHPDLHTGLAPAPHDPDRAAFLIWLIFTTNTLHPNAMTLLHPERPGGEASSRAVADATHAALRADLAALETIAASGVWWLSPDRPSITSLFIIMLLRWIGAFPAYPQHAITVSAYPALATMTRGLEARPAIQAMLKAEGLAADAFSNPVANPAAQ